MKNIHFFPILILLVSSCISQTRHQRLHPCYSALQKGDVVLIDEVPGVGSQESYRLYQHAAKVLAKQGVEARYILEEEYNMARLGIRGFADSAQYGLLRDSLGIRHLLSFQISSSSKGGVYDKWTSEELKQASYREIAEADPERKASIRFWLKPLDSSAPAYALSTTTKMRSIPVTNKKGGMTAYNLSSTGMATYKALKKGIKKLMSACNG